jgi:hypothetical protein
MVSQCANPECGKPLHYLRDGKIFLLEVQAAIGGRGRRAEHFWLCGGCAAEFDVKQVGPGVEVVPKFASRRPHAPLVDAA